MLNVVQLEKHGTPIRLAEAADDYEIVRRTLAFITDHWRRQPSVEEMAEHVGLSLGHLHHLFRRWAGLTPKDFLQAITLDAARSLLRDEASVLDTAYEVGYSGRGGCTTFSSPTRPCRRASTRPAARASSCATASIPRPSASPSWWRRTGALPASASASLGASPRALADMRGAGRGELRRGQRRHGSLAHRIFDPEAWREDRTLARLPHRHGFRGASLGDALAHPHGQGNDLFDHRQPYRPADGGAAVGAAVGKNPISFVVPCHRVLGRSGALTGYHWVSPASRRCWAGRPGTRGEAGAGAGA